MHTKDIGGDKKLSEVIEAIIDNLRESQSL